MTVETGSAESARTTEEVSSDRLPLSFAQRQLWFLHQLTEDMTAYNLQLAFRLTGPLEVGVLHQALGWLVGRHEQLRARFGVEDGLPYQTIAEPGEVTLTVLDRTGAPVGQRTELIRHTLAEATARPFDLARGPLYRFLLLRLAEDDHVLSMEFHHIVTDGWSGRILNTELGACYRALLAGGQPELPEPPVRYRDHVAEQQHRFRRTGLESGLAFWQDRLSDLPVLELPADRPRPRTPALAGDTVSLHFDTELVDELHDFARAHGSSRFAVLATVLAVLLGRYTGQSDIPIGVPMHCRTDPELEHTVGLFANMVVLRADLSGDPSFTEALRRVADFGLDMLDHQDTPFEMVVDRVQPVREPGRNPLFGVAMQVLGAATSGTRLDLPELHASSLDHELSESMFDLNLNFYESDTSLHVQATYATELFDRWRIEALLRHLEQALRSALHRPDQPIRRLALLSPQERDEVIAAGRGEQVPPWTRPVHAVVAEVAAARPDAVAAVCQGVELSYRELTRRASRLARHLRSIGVEPGQVVAIAMDRDLDVLVAMLGSWQAGAAFTVLDPRHPSSRLEFMLRDTAAPLLITHQRFLAGLPTGDWRMLAMDEAWPRIEALAADEPLPELATADSLAYVLYTSGSTGQPKGVLIDHRALGCFLQSYYRTFDFTAEDRMLQLPAITFDMSQGEIWTALTLGATLVLVSYLEGQSPELVSALIRARRVSYVGLSPAMLALLDAGPYPDLRCVMNGADAVSGELVNKWNLPGRRMVNLYGPTEAAVACTEYECEHRTWQASPPIGRPELNRLLYIVDADGNLLPRGVPGELLIGGDEGLARGYLNQPELTAEKFVADPFRPHGRVYRSGDLVRWTADWQLEFLGRIDNQVKLHGIRIELGEIEAALLSHPAVRMATVLLRADAQENKRLVAYYTGQGETAPTVAQLRQHLSERLPEHMVPTAWLALAEFPLTAARKVDRRALPDPPRPTDADGPLREPDTPTERTIAEIFATVLGVDRLSAEASFFDLAGSSFQAMRAVSRINKTFGIRANLRLLYDGKPLHAIAAQVDDLVAGRSRDG